MSLDFEGLLRRRRTPLTTYRLQLHAGFGFREAAALADYLELLGATDCYTSPILTARPGSRHGYDITDHGALNPELGGEEGYAAFSAALKSRSLGHLLDFVPNHMAADAGSNAWWRDVLENGPSSPYAEFFDIDWRPEKPELADKVLLPVLGDQYGAVLERGELRLALEKGGLSIFHGKMSFPVDPREWPQLLGRGLDRLKEDLRDDPALAEFLSVLTALGNLPARSDVDPGRAAERRRESAVARGRLEKLLAESARLERHVREALEAVNGRPGDPGSFDALHVLLESQAYRLAYWRTAADEINYRRFFDINDLVGLRVELDGVFDAAHRRVLELLAEDKITGLRIDHPDGLYDPGRYFDRLQDAFARAWLRRRARPDGELTAAEAAELAAWREEEARKDFRSVAARPLYVVAEKILSPGEELDPHWGVDGTSGYDFLNDVNRAFVDSRGAAALERAYVEFTGRPESIETVIYESKKLIMSSAMAGELNVLSDALNRISEADRRFRDFTRQSLRRALREIVACFPVYRAYVTPARATAFDRDAVDRAVARARRLNPALEPSVFEFIRALLVPPPGEAAPDADGGRRLRFAMKLQQYTGPVQAKGVEDTAFYRRHVLVSLNEVGSDPARFGGTAEQFHEANRKRAEDWPRSMLATATHDSKRGEDARARLDVLSELADEWGDLARGWAEANRGGKTEDGGRAAPDADDEYLFYQALLGAYDFSREDEEGAASLRARLGAFLRKAAREAKRNTSWIAPDEAYEKAAEEFAAKALSNRTFLDSFLPFARRVAEIGAVESLSRLVLKAASPGVADFFQGTELWDLSLVDPDNRRDVDFASRRKLLAELEPALSGDGAADRARELLAAWPDGRVKLFATAKVLRFRRANADLLMKGDYVPLEVRGAEPERFLAFRRTLGGSRAIVVAPRLIGRALRRDGLAALGSLARGASLEPAGGPFDGLRDVFTGAALPADGRLEGALSVLPFAIFARP